MSDAGSGETQPVLFSSEFIAPLVDLVRSDDDGAVAAATLRSIVVQPLDTEAWLSLSTAVCERLENEGDDQVAEAAALVPTEVVRSVLRKIALDTEHPLSAGAKRGLVGVGDADTIVASAYSLEGADAWRSIAGLALDQIETLDLHEVHATTIEHDDDAEPWRSVAFAKAGQLGPMNALLDTIERGQGPSLFWGDPEYVASLLTPCQPVPSAVKLLLEAEFASIDSAEESDRFREVGILLAGLATTESFEDLMHR